MTIPVTSFELAPELVKALNLPGKTKSIDLHLGVNEMVTLRCVHLIDREQAQRLTEVVSHYELLPAGDRAKLTTLLFRAEAFIAGFEDDQAQEGIPKLLADIRAAMFKLTDGSPQ